MRCLYALSSATSLMLIIHCHFTQAQNQGNTFFPGEVRSRTRQVDDPFRTTVIPLSISAQQDGCLDSFLPEQCKSWKETIGCRESNMRVGCKRTCGLCQTQGSTSQFPIHRPVTPTNPSVTQAPPTNSPLSECSDKAIASLCNDWRIEFGCTQVSVSKYCRKTCGLCGGLSPFPSVNQGNQVISMQPPIAQPTVPPNTGLLIISHNPAKPTQNNNLPSGPTSITLQATEKPHVTSPPAPIATSPPLLIGDRNIGINLSQGGTTISTPTTRPFEVVPTTKEPDLPVVQPMIPLDTLDILTHSGTEVPLQIPDSWIGDKSKLPFGHSALTVAAKNQRGEDVRILIQNGANIDHQDHSGLSALMWIAGHGNNNILELLLQAGASPNLTDSFGSSALMYAAFNNNVETVEMLVDFGAYVDAQDSFGETALMSAARNGHYYTVEILLAKNAQVSLQDNQGMTALHYAALKQCVQCVEMLTRTCPDIKLKNNVEKTPLDIAKEKGNIKIVTLIEGLLQPSCIHAGEIFPEGSRRVESCIELECKCGGYYEPTGNNDLSCLVLKGFL